VKEYYGDRSKFKASITYVHQGKPKGIVLAVGLCKKFVGNDLFVVYLRDNLLKSGIKIFANSFRNSGFNAMILLCEVDEPQRFGVVEFDENYKVGYRFTKGIASFKEMPLTKRIALKLLGSKTRWLMLKPF
jgi:dTDP-glucose pyrophosphorylase